jgi:hypothetical protein
MSAHNPRASSSARSTRGDHFELSRYSASGDRAEGYAMGHVNQRGWIQASWFR